MRTALIRYSERILNLSLLISVITAALVYLSLQWMIVRPMGRLTESMLRFRDRPEDETADAEASRRADEIGMAQRVLADMQTTLRHALTQRAHLAALGEAVVKINHDLRNILASAQIVSDRLAASQDPRVRAEAPGLLQAIDRAVALCSQVVLFAQSRRPRLTLANEPLHDLMEEVGDSVLALATAGGNAESASAPLRWENRIEPAIAVRGDRAQLLRLFENIARNAFEAGATEIGLHAERVADRWAVMIDDNGPGLPERAQQHLFEPFRGSARPGGTGLGLAIARELAVAHGGRLRLDKTGPEGTCFAVELPMAPLATEQRRKSA